MLQITEVMDRAQQGMTEPFICSASDGQIYFVKGASATRSGQVKEWLCANLAMALDLPVAPFALVEVSADLLSLLPLKWRRALGKGVAFASQRRLAHEFAFDQVVSVPQQLRRDILVFDWWIRNQDRCLTETVGNVNLLWTPALEQGLVVIDHNLAFDEEFNAKQFAQNHVFAGEIGDIFEDLVNQQLYVDRLTEALTVWQNACDNLPPEWFFVDAEQTIPVDFSLNAFLLQLQRIYQPDFWNLNV